MVRLKSPQCPVFEGLFVPYFSYDLPNQFSTPWREMIRLSLFYNHVVAIKTHRPDQLKVTGNG